MNILTISQEISREKLTYFSSIIFIYVNSQSFFTQPYTHKKKKKNSTFLVVLTLKITFFHYIILKTFLFLCLIY